MAEEVITLFGPQETTGKMRHAQRRQGPFTANRKKDTTVHRRAFSAPRDDLFAHIIAEFTGMLVAPFGFHEGKMVHGCVKFVIDHAQLCYVPTVVNIRDPTPQFVPVKRIVRTLNPDLRVAWMSSPGLLSFPTNRPRCGGQVVVSRCKMDNRHHTLTTVAEHVKGNRSSKQGCVILERGREPTIGWQRKMTVPVAEQHFFGCEQETAIYPQAKRTFLVKTVSKWLADKPSTLHLARGVKGF